MLNGVYMWNIGFWAMGKKLKSKGDVAHSRIDTWHSVEMTHQQLMRKVQLAMHGNLVGRLGAPMGGFPMAP